MLIEEVINLNISDKKEPINNFLNEFGLRFDDDIDYSLVVYDKGKIIGTASKAKNILKCFAISKEYQGLGITNTLVKKIEDRMFKEGLYHFFIVTPSKNKHLFTSIGYQEIITSSNLTLLENGNKEIKSFLNTLKSKYSINDDEKACIVMNANPFSKGHLYLVEKAAYENKEVIIFVVSENKSSFPFSVRYRLVKEGTKHLSNVTVVETGPYLVSNITFPTYFLKDVNDSVNIQTKMDCDIFTTYYKPIFNITKRYIGTEPYCKVTKAYNEMMKIILPKSGVEVILVERMMQNNEVISASKIRELLRNNDYQSLKLLVPLSTYNYLISQEANSIIENITTGRH